MCHTFVVKPVVPRSISAPRIIFPSVLVIAASCSAVVTVTGSGSGVGAGSGVGVGKPHSISPFYACMSYIINHE